MVQPAGLQFETPELATSAPAPSRPGPSGGELRLFAAGTLLAVLRGQDAQRINLVERQPP